MKTYINYMDSLSVDPALHKKIMEGLSRGAIHQRTVISKPGKFVPVAVGTAAVLIVFFGVYLLLNPSKLPTHDGQPGIPGRSESPDPDQSQPGMTEQGRARCHDLDISRLTRSADSSKVPFGFFFNHRLMDLARLNPGMTNRGLRWVAQGFTNEELGSALGMTIKEPDLPAGDYTLDQEVLVDEVSGTVIAYQTVYTYFDPVTLAFQKQFSIFYFPDHYFDQAELESMRNARLANEKILVDPFPEPAPAHVKIPHVRRLVYVEQGVALVIEAETDLVVPEGPVDQEKSLERYGQTDKELLDLMGSLIILSDLP
ncbi:MAG: hypothetical protein GX838_00655 [Clostridiaceae bacterium]|nr:hypothetical protein [Clostridiaceae bacterium]